jgi:hypothetical protein
LIKVQSSSASRFTECGARQKKEPKRPIVRVDARFAALHSDQVLGSGRLVLGPSHKSKRPRPVQGGAEKTYRLISTSTPGRRSLLISTSGSLTRRRSSTVTSGSRTVLPTVTSGVRVQFSPQSGPTQFRSHTSAPLAGSDRRAEPVNAAARAKARAVRISNLHDFDARQRPGEDSVPRFRTTRGIALHQILSIAQWDEPPPSRRPPIRAVGRACFGSRFLLASISTGTADMERRSRPRPCGRRVGCSDSRA